MPPLALVPAAVNTPALSPQLLLSVFIMLGPVIELRPLEFSLCLPLRAARATRPAFLQCSAGLLSPLHLPAPRRCPLASNHKREAKDEDKKEGKPTPRHVYEGKHVGPDGGEDVVPKAQHSATVRRCRSLKFRCSAAAAPA